MGLLGKIQNKTRHVLADALKRGREQEGSINNKLQRIASNIERHDPLAAATLNGIVKFNDLAAKPFRKINTYLYNKLNPTTTDESSNPNPSSMDQRSSETPHKYMDRTTRIREFQDMIAGIRLPLNDDNQ